MCELLDTLMSLNIPDYGLLQLKFSGFDPIITDIDEELITRLSLSCQHLTHLTVRSMAETSETTRNRLVQLVSLITATTPPFNLLDL